MPKLKPPMEEVVSEEGETLEPLIGKPTWSGSISIGLVNIPIRAIPITIERKISFRMLHQRCKTPISYRIFCEKGDKVPRSEIAYGYKLKGHDYLAFDLNEIASAKPASSKLIELDRFIEFFQMDPHYFERTFLLIPDNSEKPYALLRKVLETTGLAAIGKVTMSTKERVLLIHYYHNAIVATTLHYPDEVTDPSGFSEIKNLPEPGNEELALMTQIVDKMTMDLDLSIFHDSYQERIEALITSKMKGEVAQVKDEKPKKPVAKSMMEALRETLESFK